MKTEIKKIWRAAFYGLILTGVCADHEVNAQTPSAPPPAGATLTASNDLPAAETLPPDIAPNSPLAQVVQLAQSGVDESVIMTYIKNSGALFNLTSDQIIYLKDLGLPNDIVTAMIQRDQELKQMGVTSGSQTTPEVSNADTNYVAETGGPPTMAPPVEPTDNSFYDTLAPYGGWVNISGYGLCWRPTAVVYSANWQPYCDHGHWVYTDCGWYWVSDYAWGATAFHYGRWLHDSHYGWCWWPDTVWAPSWVCWRYSNDYCGWAPLPPHTAFREGAGIVFNGVAVNAGFDFGLSVNLFTFVPTQNFCDPHPIRHRVPSAQVTQIFARTTVINNFNVNSHRAIVNAGIAPQHITAVTRTEIHPVPIHTAAETARHGAATERFGQNERTLIVNRPHFNESSVSSLHNGVNPRPATPAQNDLARPNYNYNWSAPRRQPLAPAQTPQTSGQPPEHQEYPSVHPSTISPGYQPRQTPNHYYNQHAMPPRMQQQFQQSAPHFEERPAEQSEIPETAPQHQQQNPVTVPSTPAGQPRPARAQPGH